jgi:hypothetical protein
MRFDCSSWRSFPVASLRSKSWGRFTKPGARKLDFCVYGMRQRSERNMSGTAWTTRSRRIGVAEPAALTGPPEQIERAFRDAYLLLDRRIVLFLKFATGESRCDGNQQRGGSHWEIRRLISGICEDLSEGSGAFR